MALCILGVRLEDAWRHRRTHHGLGGLPFRFTSGRFRRMRAGRVVVCGGCMAKRQMRQSDIRPGSVRWRGFWSKWDSYCRRLSRHMRSTTGDNSGASTWSWWRRCVRGVDARLTGLREGAVPAGWFAAVMGPGRSLEAGPEGGGCKLATARRGEW